MSGKFKKIGIIGKFRDESVGNTIQTLYDFLIERGHEVLLDEVSAMVLPELDIPVGDRDELGEHSDLVIVVGGDGTFLNAARTLNDYRVPLLGINLGRLGFLTDIHSEKMRGRLGAILDGEYVEEERFLLHGRFEYDSGEGKIASSDAFNDIVVHKGHVARMIELDLYINGQYVNTQRADGLIVSTPTGSTAYALSGGGPILHPRLDAIVLVPICPHTMSQRPIVIDGDSDIEIRVSDNNHGDALVTCDGQLNVDLSIGDSVRITKKKTPVHLIHPADYNYYEILRAKLHWGHRL